MTSQRSARVLNVLAASAVAALLQGDGTASAQTATPTAGALRGTPITVDGVLRSRKEGPATNISGFACARPRPDGRRTCLVVDDEAGFVQRVSLDRGALQAGGTVPILTSAADPAIVGQRPATLRCPHATDKFRELDGEGVSFEETGGDGRGNFYVAGSHGCSRNDGEARLSQFILARIPYDLQEDTLGPGTQTWRLSEALAAAPVVGGHFGRALDNRKGEGGLDVEGIAVVGGRLLVGLRAPSLNGRAYILPVPLEPLFSRDGTIAPGAPVELVLGPETGIRDLAAMPDGRVLVLTGSAPDRGAVEPSLVAADLSSSPVQPRALARLPQPASDIKYEGVAILDWARDRLSVVVVQDGPANGNPTRYDVDLSPSGR